MLLKHELIGLKMKVIDAENKGLIGMEGKIVDETRNMLTIDQNGSLKKLVKSQIVMQLNHKGKKYQIDGKLLVNRPEDRIKKVRRLR